jgi:glutamine---fructose-6-phosphate transaminase (isomerizing)
LKPVTDALSSAPLPGSSYLSEIREQPAALRALLEHRAEFARVAAAAAKHGGGIVRMVGHGSSDNAASFGVYAFGLLPGLTAVRDSISLLVYYGARLDLRGSTVVALSQSGRTPDVLEYVERARRGGAFTIAITNEPASELASAAEAVLPLAAGAELAVAATKTYSNQLAALALLAGCLAGRSGELGAALAGVADQVEEHLPELERLATSFSVPFASVARMFVIGRGPEFATAREIALKLLETCQIAAEPLTATDLAHGPVAALDPLFPVWSIASEDETLEAVVDATARARAAGATVVASGTASAALVPGQLFAGAVARAKGLDPDKPRGLSKVTLAR